MRKFYSMILMAVLSAVAFIAKADPYTINIRIDDESYLSQFVAYYYDYTQDEDVFLELSLGDNPVTIDSDMEIDLALIPNSMFDDEFNQELVFTEVYGIAPGSDEPEDMSFYFQDPWTGSIGSIYLPFYNDTYTDLDLDGWTIIPVMASAADAYNVQAYVYCDEPQNVKILAGTGMGEMTEIPLEHAGDEPNVIEFNKITQAMWIIQHVDPEKSIFKVTYNEEPVEYMGYFQVMPEENSVVSITVAYPDYECSVAIEVTEGAEEAIESVMVNEKPIEDWSAPFTVQPGDEVALNYNAAYNITAISLNGIDEYPNNTCSTFRIVEETNVISIEAAAWQKYSVAINVDTPEAVSVKAGAYSWDASEIEINAQSQVVDIYENAASIFIKPVSGYVIESVKYTTDDAVKHTVLPDYNKNYTVDCSEGNVSSIDITTGVFARDNVAYIFIDNPNQNGFIICNNDYDVMLENPGWEAGNPVMQPGYNRLEFSASENPFAVRGYPDVVPVIYLNGEVTDQVTCSEWFGFEGALELSNNDVVKFYFEGQPNQHSVSFTLDGVSEDDVNIVADKVISVSPNDGHNCLAGTEILVTPNAGFDGVVKVDDNEIAAQDGSYVINVSDNHNVTISASSGVSEIAVDANNAGVMYNLQGVRVSNNATPGVYVKVVNGVATKVAVK